MSTELDRLVQCLKASRDFVYDLSNICTTEEYKKNVFKWVIATDQDISKVIGEIRRAHKLAVERCQQRYASADRPSVPLQDVVQHLKQELDTDRDFTAVADAQSVVEDLKSRKVYYLWCWDSDRPISKAQVESRLSITMVKKKHVDHRVLIARRFSSGAISLGKGAHGDLLIDLGYRGEDKWTDISLHGDLTEQDRLVSRLITLLTAFRENPEKFRIRAEPGAVSNIDPYVVDEVLRTFTEYIKITDCGHLHISERKETYPRPAQFPYEERLRRAGALGLYTPTSEEAKKKMDELMEAREKFESKINELHKSELVFSTVKKDVDGNIAPNEIQFLCRGCMENFVDRYEIPEERPHEGSRFVFKNFCNKLADELGCESEYVDIYDFGILKETTGNLLVCRGTLKQPPANIALFNPRMIIAAVNFFADRMTIPDHERFHYNSPALKPESIGLVAFNTASSLVLPTLAYDCSTDEHAYVPVGVVEPSDEQVIETLAAIDYLVSPTEKAYKAAHNRIIEICRDLGLQLGFRSETEYRFGSDRIDVAWLNPPNESLEVAIEVELGSSVTDELWKLCEAKQDWQRL